MPDSVYRRLAQRLDAIPNGFPSTESGVELDLLAKIFAPEEAALATHMNQRAESAAEIGARAGIEPDVAYRTLKTMTRKGQIWANKRDGNLVFGLMPFVVGIYEYQLPRMDEELADLVERYFGDGGIPGAPRAADPPGDPCGGGSPRRRRDHAL